jgi:hypothetical protein
VPIAAGNETVGADMVKTSCSVRLFMLGELPSSHPSIASIVFDSMLLNNVNGYW